MSLTLDWAENRMTWLPNTISNSENTENFFQSLNGNRKIHPVVCGVLSSIEENLYWTSLKSTTCNESWFCIALDFKPWKYRRIGYMVILSEKLLLVPNFWQFIWFWLFIDRPWNISLHWRISKHKRYVN